jgi:translation initiation factor IF-3
VRLIGADGQQLGVVPTARALQLAQSEGLDLVEVAPNAVPPVCKIIDFGKYRYDEQQKLKEARKRQRAVSWKEIRVSPKINEHDIETKIRAAARFLDDGDKLKVTVRFRGRELAHPDRGRALLLSVAERLKDHGALERQPLLEGRQMVMVMGPLRRDAAGAAQRSAGAGEAPAGPGPAPQAAGAPLATPAPAATRPTSASPAARAPRPPSAAPSRSPTTGPRPPIAPGARPAVERTGRSA